MKCQEGRVQNSAECVVRGAEKQYPVPRSQERNRKRRKGEKEKRGKTIMNVIVIARNTEENEGDVAI